MKRQNGQEQNRTERNGQQQLVNGQKQTKTDKTVKNGQDPNRPRTTKNTDHGKRCKISEQGVNRKDPHGAVLAVDAKYIRRN